MVKLPKSFWLIAPFATWIALMTVLPATVGGYAVRAAATAAMLAVSGFEFQIRTMEQSGLRGDSRVGCVWNLDFARAV